MTKPKIHYSHLLILLGLFVSNSLIADIFVETGHPVVLQIMPYTARLNDSNDDKTNKTLNGVYGYLARGNHSIEAEIDLFSGSNDTWLQFNSLAIYTYYGVPSTKLRTGFHQVDVNDGTDFDVVIAGYEWDDFNIYGYKTFGTEVNYFLSQGHKIDGTDFFVQQISSGINVNFASPENYQGYFTLTLSDNIQYFDTPINNNPINGRKFLNETIIKLEYFSGKWSWSGSLTKGETVFSVRNEGFVFLSNNSVNTESLTGGIKYQWAKPLTLKMDVERNTIQSFSTTTNNGAESNTTKLLFGFLWNF